MTKALFVGRSSIYFYRSYLLLFQTLIYVISLAFSLSFITVITTSCNRAHSGISVAPLFSLPFAPMKPYCYLIKTSVFVFKLLQQLSKRFYYCYPVGWLYNVFLVTALSSVVRCTVWTSSHKPRCCHMRFGTCLSQVSQAAQVCLKAVSLPWCSHSIRQYWHGVCSIHFDVE